MRISLVLCIFVLSCDDQFSLPPVGNSVDLGAAAPDQVKTDAEVPECYGSLARFCYDGPAETLNVGICRDGLSICYNGKWGPCIGQVLPMTKICNGMDNDCDGKPDYIVQECYTGPEGTEGVGPCKAGKQVCLRDKWGPCMNEIVPSKENCDGIDNNCNGVVDEYCP